MAYRHTTGDRDSLSGLMQALGQLDFLLTCSTFALIDTLIVASSEGCAHLTCMCYNILCRMLTQSACADYSYLRDSLSEGLIGQIDIDMALMRVLTQRFQLGMFDPPEQQPWSTIPIEVVGSQRHLEAAIEAVRKGDSPCCATPRLH